MDKKGIKNEYFQKGLTAFLVVAASILFYFIMLRLSGLAKYFSKIVYVLQPVIFGLVIAYLVNPIVKYLNGLLLKFLSKKIKNEKTYVGIANYASVLVSVIAFCIVVVGIVALVVPQFIGSFSDVVENLPEQIDLAIDKANKYFKSNQKLELVYTQVLSYEKKWLQNDLAKYVNNIAGSVASGVLSTLNFVKNFGIGLIIAIYLLISKKRFINQSKKLLYAVLKENVVDKVLIFSAKTHTVFSGFINGKLLDSLIIGVLCFIGVTLLGIPYTVLVSCVIGVTNVIPVFGPWIGGIPCVILVMLSNPVKGLYLGIFVILLQTLDGNIIGPKILGSKIGLNTFWVIFAIVLGGGLFGVLGMLIGVPCFAVIYYLISTLVNHLLSKKGKSIDSTDYENGNGAVTVEAEETDNA